MINDSSKIFKSSPIPIFVEIQPMYRPEQTLSSSAVCIQPFQVEDKDDFLSNCNLNLVAYTMTQICFRIKLINNYLTQSQSSRKSTILSVQVPSTLISTNVHNKLATYESFSTNVQRTSHKNKFQVKFWHQVLILASQISSNSYCLPQQTQAYNYDFMNITYILHQTYNCFIIFIMSQEQLSNTHIAPELTSEKKRKRTKGDQTNRTFACSICNKSYLSYPALYTHTKSKHQKTPAELNDKNMMKKEKPVTSTLFMNQILKILNGQSKLLIQKYTLEQVVQPFKQKQQLKRWISFWKEEPEQKLDFESKCYKTNIQLVFGKLLSNIANKTPLSKLQQLCSMLLIWRSCMNRQWKSYSIAGSFVNYCEQADSQYLLRSVNDLVLNFFPENCEQYLSKISPIHIFKGSSKDVNLCNLLLAISRWMNDQKYTKEKLKFNDYGS